MIQLTPPMGWNTWNTFGKDIDEELILKSTDAMIETGLKDAGYEYIVIDDIWALKERDENGRLVPDPEKFPHGMKYIADYVHSKGLKFGMYSCAGYLTCAGYPSSYDYEWIDAQTFASWGVDFLKYDFCFHNEAERADILYKRMGIALANCGRDILFSACSWGSAFTRQWIREVGAHMWRSTGDINDSWESVKKIAQSQLDVQEFGGINCFNDMDMLVVGMHGKGLVGMGGCSYEEYKLHFSLWALLGSPLMIGCDIRDMDEETRQILLNKEVIKINQDAAGRQAFLADNWLPQVRYNRQPTESFYSNYHKDTPVIARYLENGDIAIGIFNFTDETTNMYRSPICLDMLGLPAISGKTIELTDLWTGEKKVVKDNIMLTQGIGAHSCVLYRAKVVDKK